MNRDYDTVLVFPCSGVGKVQGLISRESAYLAVDELAPVGTDIVCLALLVREDQGTLNKVRTHPCITIDGCAKACAQKNVEIAGGTVAKAFQVTTTLRDHRGKQPGTGSELTDDGWVVCQEIAEAVADTAAQIRAGEEGTL